MRCSLGIKSLCHHVNIKVTINFLLHGKSTLFLMCRVHIYPPPDQDEVLAMLEGDEDHMGYPAMKKMK